MTGPNVTAGAERLWPSGEPGAVKRFEVGPGEGVAHGIADGVIGAFPPVGGVEQVIASGVPDQGRRLDQRKFPGLIAAQQFEGGPFQRQAVRAQRLQPQAGRQAATVAVVFPEQIGASSFIHKGAGINGATQVVLTEEGRGGIVAECPGG